MDAEQDDRPVFRDLRYVGAAVSDVIFRDSDVKRLRIIDSYIDLVELSGEVGSVIVNDVEVSEFVTRQLDERYPERVMVRMLDTPDEHRHVWQHLEDLWADTISRAQDLPEASLQERVGDEWSLAETIRHLVFAIDAWVGRTVLELDHPYHRLGLPTPDFPRDVSAELGVDVDAPASTAEALDAFHDRLAMVRALVAGIDEDQLDRVSTRAPAPGYPDEPRAVRRCIRVVMREMAEHRRYAERDLDTLRSRESAD